jgi:hypothetical protein
MSNTKQRRRKRCTWCGELINVGTERSTRDCADQLHHFHKKCWREHVEFMSAPAATRRS